MSDLWLWAAVSVSSGYAVYRVVRALAAAATLRRAVSWWLECQDCGRVSYMGEGPSGHRLSRECDECIGCSSTSVLPVTRPQCPHCGQSFSIFAPSSTPRTLKGGGEIQDCRKCFGEFALRYSDWKTSGTPGPENRGF